MALVLTRDDLTNVLGFMDRATLKGIAEAKTLAFLALKIETILDPPALLPPPSPPGKNRQTIEGSKAEQTTESNVIEFPKKEAVNV